MSPKQQGGEEDWTLARLIPTSGLKSQRERETRATSVLLAVMYAVPEFASTLLSYGRAPAGRIKTYVEVPFTDAQTGEQARPDGAIVVRRGKTKWSCLVEVKTGHDLLRDEQIEQYARIANQQGLNAILTISNEIASSAGDCPIQLDKRLLRNLKLFHLSWFRILTEAVLAHEHRGVSDPDQAWILAELINYLQHPNSGASDFEDMGRYWTEVRDGARHRTLQATDVPVRSISAHWEKFIQYLCLRLCQHLGRDVVPVYPRKMDQKTRIERIGAGLAESGRMQAAIHVPDAIGALGVEADLQSRMVTLSVEVQAPNEGRPTTRVNWMLRQLRDAPDNLRIETAFSRTGRTNARLLGEVRKDPRALLLPSDLKREPRRFALSLTGRMGTKRSKGPKSFVGDAERQLFEFYGQIVQDLHSWIPRAPKLPEEHERSAETSRDQTASKSTETTPPTDGSGPDERNSGQTIPSAPIEPARPDETE